MASASEPHAIAATGLAASSSSDATADGPGVPPHADSETVFPVERLAMVARWKPVHLGHAAVLRGLVDSAGHALIGIGSSNRYNIDNPFTAAETAAMIRSVLAGRDNYTLIEVPDLGNGPKWRLMVRDLCGPLQAFVTANDYVHGLMRDLYPVIHPARLVPPRERTRLSGTDVRRAILAGGDDWQRLVPRCVADYLCQNGLIERFRREFGANAAPPTPQK